MSGQKWGILLLLFILYMLIVGLLGHSVVYSPDALTMRSDSDSVDLEIPGERWFLVRMSFGVVAENEGQFLKGIDRFEIQAAGTLQKVIIPKNILEPSTSHHVSEGMNVRLPIPLDVCEEVTEYIKKHRNKTVKIVAVSDGEEWGDISIYLRWHYYSYWKYWFDRIEY